MPTDYDRQPSVATTTIITIVGIGHRMDRRRLLMAGSTAVTAGLAGCSGLLGGGGSEDEEPAQPEITRIGIEITGGQGQITGTISNPTDSRVTLDLFVRIYSSVDSPGTLQDQSPEEELDRPDIGIPAGEDGGIFLSIPEVITVSRLSDNLEAALVEAGETPAESDYRWYGPDAATLNGEGQ